MRAIFGVVSLLVVLAVVGLLVVNQLKAVNHSVSSAAVQAGVPGASAASPAQGTVREQAQQLQQKVANDVIKAMEQGARKDESDK